MDNGNEVRITDSQTGGQKGQKLAQLGALDPQALMEVAKIAGFGAQKYERYNYLKGFDWSLSYDALQRHLHEFWNGSERDEESGLLHMAHAAWQCLCLLSFSMRGLGNDDRYKGDGQAESHARRPWLELELKEAHEEWVRGEGLH